MKKLSIIALIFFILFTFIACSPENFQELSTTDNKQPVSAVVTSNTDSQTKSDTLKETGSSNSGGGELTLQKYRSIYYSIPAPFWDIVDENSRKDIYGEYWEQPYSEINIMRMRIFVEEYNVPREKFDAANAEWARIVKEKLYSTPVIDPQDFANQEFNEVYNADIIYTFDNELINEYYLSHDYPYCYESEYEKAVESGEYISRTAEIIDLSQLKEELEYFNQIKNEALSSNTDVSEITSQILKETEASA